MTVGSAHDGAAERGSLATQLPSARRDLLCRFYSWQNEFTLHVIIERK